MSKHVIAANVLHEASLGAANGVVRISNFIPFSNFTPRAIPYVCEIRLNASSPWLLATLVSGFAYTVILPAAGATGATSVIANVEARLDGGTNGQWILFTTSVHGYTNAPRELVGGDDVPMNAAFNSDTFGGVHRLVGTVHRKNDFPITAYPVDVGVDGLPLAGADDSNPATNLGKQKTFFDPNFNTPTADLEIHRTGTGTNGGTLLLSFLSIFTDDTLLDNPADFVVDSTVVNPSISGAADGSITLIVTKGVGPFSFLWSDAVITQNRTGLLAGFYSVEVTDDGNPTNVKNFDFNVVDPAVIVGLFPETFVSASPINPIRFKIDEGVFDNVSVLKNPDNADYCNNPPERFTAPPYSEIFNVADSTKIQFKSDYETNTLQLFDDEGTFIKNLTLINVVDNLNDFTTQAGFVRDNGAGQLRVYPSSGVLPANTAVGNFIALNSIIGTYNNEYQIISLEFDVGLSSEYMIVEGVYSIDENVDIQFLNNKRYNVFEATINMLSDLGLGRWKLKFVGGEAESILLSEFIEVRSETLNTLVLKYKNVDTAFDVDWTTEIEMTLRVQGFYLKSVPARDASIHRNSNDVPQILNGFVRRKHEMKIFELPWFGIERLSLVYSCDTFIINNKEYLVEEFPEPEQGERTTLSQYTLIVEEKAWLVDQNSHDVGEISESPIEVIGGEGIDVLGI